MSEVKVNRAELLSKVREIVFSHTQDPAEELIVMGEALVKIGEALRGLESRDAKAVITAVSVLTSE